MVGSHLGFAVFEDGTAPGPIMFEDDIDWIQKFIGCHNYELIVRAIDGRNYCILIDDDGRLTRRKPTAINRPVVLKNVMIVAQSALVGTLIITRLDDNGEEFLDLTEEDIQHLESNLFMNADGRYLMANISARSMA